MFTAPVPKVSPKLTCGSLCSEMGDAFLRNPAPRIRIVLQACPTDDPRDSCGPRSHNTCTQVFVTILINTTS